MYNMLLRGTRSCLTWLGTGLNTLTHLSQPNQQHGWHVDGAGDNPDVDGSGLLGRWLGLLRTVLDASTCHSICNLCMLRATPSGYTIIKTPHPLSRLSDVEWAEGASANPQVHSRRNHTMISCGGIPRF